MGYTSALTGIIGVYFLCVDSIDQLSVNKGDVLAIICAVFFAVHILLIEKDAPKVDGIQLSCIQFWVSGGLSCVLMFWFEKPDIGAITKAAFPLMYAGIGSGGIAFTLQIIGQKYTEATLASLLLCMESVFAVLSSAVANWLAPAVFTEGQLSGRQIAGCVIMFASIIASQLIGQRVNRSKIENRGLRFRGKSV